MAASKLLRLEKEVQLPGELPKALRSLRSKSCSFDPILDRASADCCNPASQSPRNADPKPSPDLGASSKVECWSRGEESPKDFRQLGQGGSYENVKDDEHPTDLNCGHSADDDPLKVLRRLDNIIDRLLSSCNEKPEVSLPPPDQRSEDRPNVRKLEEHLEEIIKRLSDRRHLERVHGEELLMTPVTAKPNKLERAGSCSTTPKSFSRRSGITPITPRSLFTRSSSAEKLDPLGSPPAARASSRSGRFAAALSFLSSPTRAGFTSLRIGSPSSHRTQDVYMER